MTKETKLTKQTNVKIENIKTKYYSIQIIMTKITLSVASLNETAKTSIYLCSKYICTVIKITVSMYIVCHW